MTANKADRTCRVNRIFRVDGLVFENVKLAWAMLCVLTALIILVSCAARPRLPDEERQVSIRDLMLVDGAVLADSIISKPGAGAYENALSGWLHLIHSNNSDLAISRFETALGMDPHSALAHFGFAHIARARLDEEMALRHYLSILHNSPQSPLARPALEDLSSLIGKEPDFDIMAMPIVRELEKSTEASPALRISARAVLRTILQSEEDSSAHKKLVGLGSPRAWKVAGPFSRFVALEPQDFFQILESGVIEESYEGPFGEIKPWIESSPDGWMRLRQSAKLGDVYYAAVDIHVPEGAEFYFYWSSRSHLEVTISGVKLFVRDALKGNPPSRGIEKVYLSSGRHRLVVRLLEGFGSGNFELVIMDRQGSPISLDVSPSEAGAPPDTWLSLSQEDPERRLLRFRRQDPQQDPQREDEKVTVLAEKSWLGTIFQEFEADLTGTVARYIGAQYFSSFYREGAKPLVDELLELAPSFAGGFFLKAYIDYYDGTIPSEIRDGRAGAAARATANLDPLHARARLFSASIAVEQSRYLEALALLEEVEAISPHSDSLIIERANYFYARGQDLLAGQTIENGLKIRPDNCRLLESVYRARRNDRDFEGSDDAAARLKSCGPSGRFVWTNHLASRGYREEAIVVLGKLIKDNPCSFSYRSRLVNIFISERRLAEAKEQLRDMLEIWPKSSGLLLRLADIAALRGQDEEALRLRRRYLELEPFSHSNRRMLAHHDGGELLDWAAKDLEQEIQSYLADDDRRFWGTDDVLVVDHMAVEVFAEDPQRPVVIERVQMVTEINTKKGLDKNGEVSLPRGAVVVDVHTRKADGRIFEPEITAHKDTITLAGLEIGDFVVVDYLIFGIERSAGLPGWAANQFYVQVQETPIQTVSYVARAPLSVGMEVDLHGVDASQPVEEDGFLLFRFSTQDVPPVQAEPESVRAEEILPWFQVGSGASPEAAGDVWGDYLVSRESEDYEILGFKTEIMHELNDDDLDDRRELIRILAEKVNQRILGTAPSTRLGERAGYSLARGRGNRLQVTRALLSAFGIRSRIAFIRPLDGYPLERRFPSGDLYRYAVLIADPGDEGPPIYIDQNIRLAPVGELRPIHSSMPAILLADSGLPTEIIVTPEADRDRQARDSTIRLEVDINGNLKARGRDTYHGFWGAMVRSGMEQADHELRRQRVEASLANAFGPIHLVDLSFEGVDDAASSGEPVVVNYEFDVIGWARVTEDMISIPGGTLFPAMMSRRMIRLSSRRLPMLLQTEPVRLLLAEFIIPDGFVLSSSPFETELSTPYGQFVRVEKELGDRLLVEERLEFELTRVLPEDYPGFVEFAAMVDRAQSRGFKFQLKDSKEGAAPVAPAVAPAELPGS